MRRFANPFTLIMLLVLAYLAISGGRFSNPGSWLMSTLLLFPGIIIALSFHEYAHAAMAYRLGDNTPKFQGRVTVNPMAHLDPIGLICILFIGFGWGKPVMVNPGNFGTPRRDDLLVSLAGVATNLILAFAFGILLAIYVRLLPLPFLAGFLGKSVAKMITETIRINLVLMVFNLIPVPPLDGFNVVSELLNIKHTELYYKIYQNGMFILMILILFNIAGTIIWNTAYPLYYFILSIFL